MVDAPPPLRWTDWPARRQPVRSAASALVIGCTAAAVGLVDGWLALVAVGVLVWATSDVLIPATYTVDDRGLTVARALVSRRHGWSRFTGYRSTDEGFVLLGRGHHRALRQSRTVLLRCDEERGRVRAALDTVLTTGEHP
ncbi:MAG: hypothetical protein AAGA48_19990 [Myxococcota bacterium]